MTPQEKFKKAVTLAECLEWKPGLEAVKKSEGKDRIGAKEPRLLLGSADIDKDCESADPGGHRWDYLIGYEGKNSAVCYFVEPHSAETSEVSTMEAKLEWLRDFLQRDSQAELAKLPREIYWVASGRVKIPKHTPQFRRLSTTLRKLGLKGPVQSLQLT